MARTGYISLLKIYAEKPLVTNEPFAILILLVAIGYQFYLAVKNRSAVLLGITYTMAMITAFAADTTQAFFLISMVTTTLGVYLFWKYNWWFVCEIG